MNHDCDRAAKSAALPADPEETPVEFIVGYAVSTHVGTKVSGADGAFGVGDDSSMVGVAVENDVGRRDLGIRGFGSGLGLGFALDLMPEVLTERSSCNDSNRKELFASRVFAVSKVFDAVTAVTSTASSRVRTGNDTHPSNKDMRHKNNDLIDILVQLYVVRFMSQNNPTLNKFSVQL